MLDKYFEMLIGIGNIGEFLTHERHKDIVRFFTQKTVNLKLESRTIFVDMLTLLVQPGLNLSADRKQKIIMILSETLNPLSEKYVSLGVNSYVSDHFQIWTLEEYNSFFREKQTLCTMEVRL